MSYAQRQLAEVFPSLAFGTVIGIAAALSVAGSVILGSTSAHAAIVTDPNGDRCDDSNLVPGPGGTQVCAPSAIIKNGKGDGEEDEEENGPVSKWPGWPPSHGGPVDPGQAVWRGLTEGLGPGAGLANLGLYTAPGQTPAFSLTVHGGGAGIQNDGYGARDSAGLIAPGTQTPDFDGGVGNAGITAAMDVSDLFGLAGGQILTVNGRFDYSNIDIDYKSTPAEIQLGAFSGSLDRDSYAFSGGFEYSGYNGTYVTGWGGGAFGDGTLKNAVSGSTGDFDSSSYFFDLRVGHVFKLATVPGRRVWGLDLSGHGGYFSNTDDAFTDSAGFTFGEERVRFGMIGGRAKLLVVAAGHNKFWVPYVAGTIDEQLDFSHKLIIPDQALSPADTIRFSQGNTFGGAEIGLDVAFFSGVTVGLKGFYRGSSDTDVEGGRAYLKIPFGSPSQPVLLK